MIQKKGISDRKFGTFHQTNERYEAGGQNCPQISPIIAEISPYCQSLYILQTEKKKGLGDNSKNAWSSARSHRELQMLGPLIPNSKQNLDTPSSHDSPPSRQMNEFPNGNSPRILARRNRSAFGPDAIGQDKKGQTKRANELTSKKAGKRNPWRKKEKQISKSLVRACWR
jgi:hypothetical protein